MVSSNPTKGPESTQVVRFNVRARVEHGLAIVLVLLLCATGLPQKYPDASWAGSLVDLFDGVGAMRAWHHAAGYVLAALFIQHLIVAIWLLAARGRTAMLVSPRDFRDAVDHLRYCFGQRPEPPAAGRYDFRQKFDYWFTIFGAAAMITSGIALRFPSWVVSLLPGEVVPAAREAHGGEALLMLMTLLLWHMYAAHARPGAFPIDKSIFTGRISLARMRSEHPLEELGEEPVSQLGDHSGEAVVSAIAQEAKR